MRCRLTIRCILSLGLIPCQLFGGIVRFLQLLGNASFTRSVFEAAAADSLGGEHWVIEEWDHFVFYSHHPLYRAQLRAVFRLVFPRPVPMEGHSQRQSGHSFLSKHRTVDWKSFLMLLPASSGGVLRYRSKWGFNVGPVVGIPVLRLCLFLFR